MDEIKEGYYRLCAYGLCSKLRCSPEELSLMCSFGPDGDKILKKLAFEGKPA